MKALDIYLTLAKLDPSPAWQLPVNYQAAMTYEKIIAAGQCDCNLPLHHQPGAAAWHKMPPPGSRPWWKWRSGGSISCTGRIRAENFNQLQKK